MNSRQKTILYSLIAALCIALAVGGVICTLIADDILYRVILLVGIISGVTLSGFFGVLAVKSYYSEHALIKNSFNQFVDEIISYNSIGTIIYDNEGKILWTSAFVKNRFGRKWIGLTLVKFFEALNVNFDPAKKTFNFNVNDTYYNANIWALENCLSIRDNTIEQKTLKIYENELTVLGEVEIDNYQLYQSILSEEQLYNLNKEVVNVLDSLVVAYNLVYRQYTNGKFLIITNKESLDKMIKRNFDFFDNLHDVLKSSTKGVLVSVSAGFAIGTRNLNSKLEQAKSALLQAQSRGGDQIAIFSKNDSPKYYGSTVEILPDSNLTKIKALTYLIEAKLSDSKLTKVIAYGHKNADLDAIGSTLGMISLAKAYKKEVYICSSTQDTTTKKALAKYFPNDYDDIFIKPQQANKLTDANTIIFICDVSDPARTDNPDLLRNALNNNIFVLDHHRLAGAIDFCPKINRYIDVAASSASEIVVEVLSFSKKQVTLTKRVAQMILDGIYLDTLQFTKRSTAKTFQAASWLESKGADSSKSSEMLKIEATTYSKITELLSNLQEVKPGFFLAYKDIPMSDDIISIAAEEVLKISGRKASFVVARQEKGKGYKLSARGINTNVQIICESVGGGGHFGTAAAFSTEDLKTFVDNIKQAIVSVRHESNTN